MLSSFPKLNCRTKELLHFVLLSSNIVPEMGEKSRKSEEKSENNSDEDSDEDIDEDSISDEKIMLIKNK